MLRLVWILSISFAAAAAEPRLAVYPPAVTLETRRDRQTFVVQYTEAGGLTRDVSSAAKIELDGKFVKRDGHTFLPLADGSSEITVSHAGLTVKVPVVVKQANDDRAVSFKLDVMPIFLRAGCNSGGCHGAARGKDGFRLSLFGYDPDGDWTRLCRELNGRRINLALPKESLLIEKSIGKVPHTGGKKIAEGDEYYATLMRWIEADTPSDKPDVASPVSVEVFPPNAVLDGKGETQRLVVRAKYSDGSDRDVTKLALFMSNNDTVAKIDGDGIVTAGERGEAFVMARFHTFTVGVPFISLPKGLTFDTKPAAIKNYIDTLVNAKLDQLRIDASPLCDDPTFVRRLYLDVCGRLPTPEEVARFLLSQVPNKRDLLVDELLERKEFAEVWVMKWADLLQVRTTNDVSRKSVLLYHNWLQEKIGRNVPTNEWVRELLGATGSTFKVPPTNYYQVERDLLKLTENAAQTFLGMRIQCAQCHNHPFDRWTMDDYYGFASFFAQVGRKGTEDPRELVIFNSNGGEINHPVYGKPMPPKFLGGAVQTVPVGVDRRKVLAGWIADPANPYFAKNLANIVWSHFLGQGIVDPVDDVRISNPASNQALLDELGKKFVAYNYDFRKLVGDICKSATYQRSTQATEANKSDTRNFARASIRRIRAETLLDCIAQATDAPNKFPGLPMGAKAVQIADGQTSTYFLQTFGRPMRESVCSCEVRLEPTLSQSLHLMNGDTVSPKIRQGKLVEKWLAEKKSPEQIIEIIYLRSMSRLPTPKETAALMESVTAAGPDKLKVLEDVFWSVLNSREFMFNH